MNFQLISFSFCLFPFAKFPSFQTEPMGFGRRSTTHDKPVLDIAESAVLQMIREQITNARGVKEAKKAGN